jgi:hypothetical protein
MMLFRIEERTHLNLITLNCEEAIAFTMAIFGCKEFYVPSIDLL